MTKRLHGSGLLFVAFLGTTGLAWASGFEFEAKLSGAQEVPAVTTATGGSLDIEFDEGFTEADFVLRVTDGDDVTQAHLHCNRAGQNGPVVAFLYGLGPTVDVDGILSSGTLTNASFTGADCVPSIGRPINNLAALAFAARDGLIYANAHTVAHPPGEVRGQLVGEDDCDDGDDDDGHHDEDDDDFHDHSTVRAPVVGEKIPR